MRPRSCPLTPARRPRTPGWCSQHRRPTRPRCGATGGVVPARQRCGTSSDPQPQCGHRRQGSAHRRTQDRAAPAAQLRCRRTGRGLDPCLCPRASPTFPASAPWLQPQLGPHPQSATATQAAGPAPRCAAQGCHRRLGRCPVSTDRHRCRSEACGTGNSARSCPHRRGGTWQPAMPQLATEAPSRTSRSQRPTPPSLHGGQFHWQTAPAPPPATPHSTTKAIARSCWEVWSCQCLCRSRSSPWQSLHPRSFWVESRDTIVVSTTSTSIKRRLRKPHYGAANTYVMESAVMDAAPRP